MNDGSQSEPTDGPTSGWRQRSVVEVVVVIAVEIRCISKSRLILGTCESVTTAENASAYIIPVCTAQGGSGSFKDRKLIKWEIGCYE